MRHDFLSSSSISIFISLVYIQYTRWGIISGSSKWIKPVWQILCINVILLKRMLLQMDWKKCKRNGWGRRAHYKRISSKHISFHASRISTTYTRNTQIFGWVLFPENLFSLSLSWHSCIRILSLRDFSSTNNNKKFPIFSAIKERAPNETHKYNEKRYAFYIQISGIGPMTTQH